MINNTKLIQDLIDDPVGYYNFSDKLAIWDLIPLEQKKMMMEVASNSYSMDKAVELFNSKKLNKDQSYNMFLKCMDLARCSTNFPEVVSSVRSLGADYEKLFRIFLKSLGPKKGFAARALFCYKDVTIEEEVAGLRSCTVGMNYDLSSFISDLKYQPRADALKEMPTVMRLACLEKLTDDLFVPYNVFGKITSDEEFKSLLFGPVLRHQERAEAIWERYCELKHIGTPGKVSVVYDCQKCGEIKIIIESNVLRTKDRIRSTRFGEQLLSSRCPICQTLGSPPTLHGTERLLDE